MTLKKILMLSIICLIGGGLMSNAAIAADNSPYKVGAVFSVTGGASFLGDPEKKTAEMIAEQINQNGGINGHPLELIVYDDETDATKCTLAVKKLINKDKVCAIIGPSVSGFSLAVIPLAEQNKIPLVSCAASHKIVHNDDTGKPYQWVFKTPQSDTLAVEAIYAHMQKKGIQKIAIITVNDGYGSSGRGELTRLAPDFGIEIVADEKYGPKDPNMMVQMTKIKAAGPQAIVNWSTGPTQVTVMRDRKDLGMMDIAFYQSHGFGSRENIKLAAGAAEGVICPLGACNVAEILPDSHPQKAVAMAYHKNFSEKYNEPLSSFGGHAWDALKLIARALEAVGDDKAKIRDHIEGEQSFVGQHGVFHFTPEDHNGLDKDAFNMITVKDGDWAMAD